VETVSSYLRADLRSRERVRMYVVLAGLDSAVRGFVLNRDHPPDDPPPCQLDFRIFRKVVGQLVAEIGELASSPASRGITWLRERAEALAGLLTDDDPARVFAGLRANLGRLDPLTKRADFDGDKAGWAVWKRLKDATDGGGPSLREQLFAPFHAWLGTQLVRLFPVVVALYERAKERHKLLDQLDLLLKLRDLLREQAPVRRACQDLYDHILVDEFQDTDPLQAEILVYLCEDPTAPGGKSWEDARLRPGVLTLVGDPKQSIYRFRRADITTYARAQATVSRHPHLRARLAANFRSRGSLIAFVNDRFAKLLGTAAADPARIFDAETGAVFHQPLAHGRLDPADGKPAVQVVPISSASSAEARVDEVRAIEGRALAHYLRWLIEVKRMEITDPNSGIVRPLRWGDIAVLAFSTMTLDFLFEGFDELSVPYTSRGGVLFLADPLHRLFLLGLRALADRKDGPAQAALWRPPFFSIDLTELLSARGDDRDAKDDSKHDSAPGVARVHAARELVAELRFHRFDRSPGETARALLETTAFGRQVALGPNGPQRLARLRELCLQIDLLARKEGLDFDGVTARVRDWVSRPIPLDPPNPVGDDAVQVLTVHQAKGLEWPVVILWDGCAQLHDFKDRPIVWRNSRDNQGWLLRVDGLEHEHPPGGGLAGRETRFRNAERNRLAYVAATRARDLLVITKPIGKRGDFVSSALLEGAPQNLLHELEPFDMTAGAAWSRGISTPKGPKLDGPGSDLEAALSRRWSAALAQSGRPQFQPRGITATAHGAVADEDESADPGAPRVPRPSRFGATFGDAVHRAIGSFLGGHAGTIDEAVEKAARSAGLNQWHAEARDDVSRTLQALAQLGLTPPVAATTVKLEYPVAAPADHGTLLLGYVDLVFRTPDGLTVIDFKTDAPPARPGRIEATHPEYVTQVQAYARLLRPLAARIRAGLLFTGDGEVRWVTT
jgi:ATP-dependent helicase/nuclease subunit A